MTDFSKEELELGTYSQQEIAEFIHEREDELNILKNAQEKISKLGNISEIKEKYVGKYLYMKHIHYEYFLHITSISFNYNLPSPLVLSGRGYQIIDNMRYGRFFTNLGSIVYRDLQFAFEVSLIEKEEWEKKLEESFHDTLKYL